MRTNSSKKTLRKKLEQVMVYGPHPVAVVKKETKKWPWELVEEVAEEMGVRWHWEPRYAKRR